MTVTIQLAAYTAVLTILYFFITSRLRQARFKAFARSRNCGEPLDLTGPAFQGFSRLYRLFNMKNSGEDILDDILAELFHHAPSYTMKTLDGATMFQTIEPANIQAMLATQFHDFEVGERRYHQMRPIIGRSIFTSDGPFWEHSRAIFRPQFSRENINDLESTRTACEELMSVIGESDPAGWTQEVDLMPLFYNLTLDTATDFLFGKSVGSQAAGIRARRRQLPGEERVRVNVIQSAGEMGSSEQFSKDFATVGEKFVTRIQLQSLYWLGDGLEFRRAIKRIKAFVEHFVERALEASKSEKPEEKKYHLLSELVKQTQDLNELRNQTLAILVAGRDTTAALLGWALLRLAIHPEVFQKLRGVILKDFLPGEEISFAKLKACRYLQHTLSEVLRLHPLIPINFRLASKDTTLPTGGGKDRNERVAVQKGTVVVFSPYLMQRRKDLWGDDALEFKPERWERRTPAWHFIPFSGGPRICIGQQFALTEASYVLVKLVTEFDAVEPVDSVQMGRMKKALGLTMWPSDGVQVRMHRATV